MFANLKQSIGICFFEKWLQMSKSCFEIFCIFLLFNYVDIQEACELLYPTTSELHVHYLTCYTKYVTCRDFHDLKLSEYE